MGSILKVEYIGLTVSRKCAPEIIRIALFWRVFNFRR